MSDPRERQAPPGGRARVLEISVAGALGPVLRAAFADQRITTHRVCTVIRTGTCTDQDLTDLVRILVERGLGLLSVQRLTDVVDPPGAGAESSAADVATHRAPTT